MLRPLDGNVQRHGPVDVPPQPPASCCGSHRENVAGLPPSDPGTRSPGRAGGSANDSSRDPDARRARTRLTSNAPSTRTCTARDASVRSTMSDTCAVESGSWDRPGARWRDRRKQRRGRVPEAPARSSVFTRLSIRPPPVVRAGTLRLALLLEPRPRTRPTDRPTTTRSSRRK